MDLQKKTLDDVTLMEIMNEAYTRDYHYRRSIRGSAMGQTCENYKDILHFVAEVAWEKALENSDMG